MKSNLQNKQINATIEQIERKLNTLIYETSTIMTSSYQQIMNMLENINSILHILKQNPTFNFSSFATIHFFPPNLIHYLDLVSNSNNDEVNKINTKKIKKKKKKRSQNKKNKQKNILKYDENGCDNNEVNEDEEEIDDDYQLNGYEDEEEEFENKIEKVNKVEIDNKHELFQLTTIHETQFGNLQEVMFHSDDSDDVNDNTMNGKEKISEDLGHQLLEKELNEKENKKDVNDEDDENLFNIVTDSDEEDEDSDEKNQQEKEDYFEMKNFHTHINQLGSNNKKHHEINNKELKKRKKLKKNQPTVFHNCSECNQLFSGQGIFYFINQLFHY